MSKEFAHDLLYVPSIIYKNAGVCECVVCAYVPVGLYQTAANANDIPRYLEAGEETTN